MLSQPLLQLPAEWVDRIFDRLAMIYGSQFLARWAGQDLLAVKRIWSEELSVFASHPGAIKHGLQNLPPNDPPNVLTFKALCLPYLRQERQEAIPALPAPKANPQRAAPVVAAAHSLKVAGPSKAWAYKLKAREEFEAKNPPESGRRMTQFQREKWRQVLG